MTYAFTHMGNFLLLLLLLRTPLKSQFFFGFGHQDWDLGLETGIWALRLGFEGGMEKEEEEEKKEEEKIPHMCESIGHRPLRGRCPKGSLVSHKITAASGHESKQRS